MKNFGGKNFELGFGIAADVVRNRSRGILFFEKACFLHTSGIQATIKLFVLATIGYAQ